jgi:ADP-dependent NAD(P)H-hydrate dehydratase / NAD(P)H-hydrate epimerase
MRVLFSHEMKQLDQKMIVENKIPGLLLMENAAQGLFDSCMALENDHSKYYIFCGIGNNGGDGFAVARHLLTHGRNVTVFLIGSKINLKGDAKINAGFFIKYNQINFINNNTDIGTIFERITRDDVVIDALFGTGLTREVSGVFYDVIKAINGSDASVLSVDIPSGVCADTGKMLGLAVNAKMTLTFQYPKPGHFLFPGRDLKGRLRIHKIGIDDNLKLNSDINISAYSKASKELSLKKRQSNTHKGSYGKLALICSSLHMSGAGLLSARAALRSGVGVLYLGVPDCVHALFQAEINTAPAFAFGSKDGALNDVSNLDAFVSGKDALAIGPGITTNASVHPFVHMALLKYDMPKVLDADALNILSDDISILDRAVGDIVLTPHPLEFARLCGKKSSEIIENPMQMALDFARQYNVTVLLKGATTIVANAKSDIALVLTGTNGMAKGGSGDVLTGIIGSLMAQGYDGYQSAVLGAYIAGIAGEMAKSALGDASMTPVDTIDKIAQAIHNLTQ